MSTMEEISLQPPDSNVAKDGDHTTRTETLEQNDAMDSRQETSLTTIKGTASQVAMSRWKKIFTTVAALLAFAFLKAGISMISPFYPIVAKQHGVPTYIVGLVIGTASLFVTVISPLSGYFLSHLGLKFTQIAGLLWGGGSLILFGEIFSGFSVGIGINEVKGICYQLELGTFALMTTGAFSRNIGKLSSELKFVSMMPTSTLFILFSFLLRIMEGIGTAMYSTVAYTQITQFFPGKKGTAVGLLQLSTSAGFAIGPTIGGGLQEVGGFKLPFLFVGGCIIILMVILMVLLQPTECSVDVLPWRLVLKLLSNIMFVLIVLALVLSNILGCAIQAYFGQFLYMQFHLSVGIIGVIYFVMLLAFAGSTIPYGILTDKLRIPRCLIIAGLVVSCIGFVFIGPPEFITTPKLWLSVLACTLLGAGWSLTIVPTYLGMTEAANNSGTLHEEAAAIMSTLSGILVGGISAGECLGPIIGGALVYRLGFRTMAAILGLIALVYALVLVIATVIPRVWKECWKFNRSRKSSEHCC